MVVVPASVLHGVGGIIGLSLKSSGRKPLDRHLLLVIHEDSGVGVWDFRCALLDHYAQACSSGKDYCAAAWVRGALSGTALGLQCNRAKLNQSRSARAYTGDDTHPYQPFEYWQGPLQ